MVSWHGMDPLICVGKCWHAQRYLCVIADRIHPFVFIEYPARDEYFEKDNSSIYTAKIFSRSFKLHDRNFTFLSWPAQSPDFILIENLWDETKWGIWLLDLVPFNLKALEKAIHQIWSEIFHTTYPHLIQSIPRRIYAMLKAKGGL
ncbi:uncharacterized protein TNCV_2910991 [Trichonephila clavipes]|nr:uncharacterized protein TNCV_2910991 [Trichonephila clavipes]